MNNCIFEIKENRRIAKDVYELRLSGDTCEITAPGQFVNIKLNGFYLRRPISVCDCGGGELTLIYKRVGAGTEYLSTLERGARLDLLCGLGNGYDISKSGARPLVAGGGVGVPPLYLLTKRLVEAGVSPVVIMGFNTAEDVFYEKEFRALTDEVYIATADGSFGVRGFVTDALEKAGEYTYLYTCGPEPMLKALYFACGTGGQFSFEERMGCGFGACMGCSCKTRYGSKRICKDGPVLEKEEIIW